MNTDTNTQDKTLEVPSFETFDDAFDYYNEHHDIIGDTMEYFLQTYSPLYPEVAEMVKKLEGVEFGFFELLEKLPSHFDDKYNNSRYEVVEEWIDRNSIFVKELED